MSINLKTDNTFMAISINNNIYWESPYNSNLLYSIIPYGKIELEPAATILNYGQGIFEGMKAYITNKNNIVLFRPDMNYKRLVDGCNRLVIPIISYNIFIDMCINMIQKNIDNIPDTGDGEFYIRPILFGSGPGLGISPSNNYTLIIYGTPIKNYFNNNINLLIENKYNRACINGMGDIKSVGNYAQTFLPLQNAKSNGFTDILYMDIDNQYIEECSSSNFFCIDKDNNIKTPKLSSILPGITRDSVLELCKELKDNNIINNIIIDNITINDIMESKEAFLTGTAAGIKVINSITHNDIKKEFNNFFITNKIIYKYNNIRMEIIEDKHNWLFYISRKFDNIKI